MTAEQILLETEKRKMQNDVHMDKVSSIEHYMQIGYEPKQVLRSINIQIKRSEMWAITGKSEYELKLLLEIMANIKPYYSGKCMLAERGMMRKKRAIIPHVFYIGDTSMIYNNMNVLEFLMFVTANSNFDVVSQQERIFEQLISFGLGNVSLTPISTLTAEYKAIILLLVGIYSNSQLIILNLPNLVFNKAQINVFIKIIEYMRNKERTFVVSTMDPILIEEAFNNTAFLYDGKLIYKGTIEKFINKFDKTILTIEDHNPDSTKEKLCLLLPYYDFSITGDVITVSSRTLVNIDTKTLHEKIIAAGYSSDKININLKTMKNACEEIVKRYDLQK